jgi:glycosyltransferase involved in cell wall biosynthesis
VKLAYFVLPHIGGTYSVFKSLREGLAPYGVDVRWLGMAYGGHKLHPDMREEMNFGSIVELPRDLTEMQCAQHLALELESQGYDGIFINVLSDRIQTNIARYLHKDIFRLMIVHNITPGTYAAAIAIRDYVHATIGVSERCRHDLVTRHGFPAERTFAIANAVDTDRFIAVSRKKEKHEQPLRVLFLGRIEDDSKGVFWLPSILQALPPTVRLTIAGDGPDLPALKTRMARQADQVDFRGAVRAEGIPALVAEHDVFVMPSRFEGFGMVLIEAMAGGCVPVASNIHGVTDNIVDDSINGLLFPIGDCRRAARAIQSLHDHREKLREMSEAGREKAIGRFSVASMGKRYHDVIHELAITRPRLAAPLSFDQWAMPHGLRPGIRSYVPRPLKNWLRVMRERL